MKWFGWKGLNTGIGPRGKDCRHEAVYRDPLLGGFGCSKCHLHFVSVPDRMLTPPRVMSVWQRLRWAFLESTKVTVVPFVWTHAWGRLRQAVPMSRWLKTEAPARSVTEGEPTPRDMSPVVDGPPSAAAPVRDWPVPAPIYKTAMRETAGAVPPGGGTGTAEHTEVV